MYFTDLLSVYEIISIFYTFLWCRTYFTDLVTNIKSAFEKTMFYISHVSIIVY
jgi:hypothetical protein